MGFQHPNLILLRNYNRSLEMRAMLKKTHNVIKLFFFWKHCIQNIYQPSLNNLIYFTCLSGKQATDRKGETYKKNCNNWREKKTTNQLDFLTATCNSCFPLAERLLTASPPCGKPWCLPQGGANTCQSQQGEEDRTLLFFFSWFFMRKCCPIPIKPLSLQHPRCGNPCLWAAF